MFKSFGLYEKGNTVEGEDLRNEYKIVLTSDNQQEISAIIEDLRQAIQRKSQQIFYKRQK